MFGCACASLRWTPDRMTKSVVNTRTPYLIGIALLTTLLTWLAWNTNAPKMGHVLTNASDPLGYYQWLPWTFLHGDWSALPYVNYLPNGKGLSLFSMGVAILQAPFFLMALIYCKITGSEITGFELPFVLTRLLAAAFYASAGLALLFRVLARSWPARTVWLACGLLLFGTNLYYYTVHDGGMSHIYSFFLFAVLVHLTVAMLEDPSGPRLMLIMLCSTVIVLIRPLNGVVLLVPLLYGPHSVIKSIRMRYQWVLRYWRWSVVGVGFSFVLLLPQLLYWKYATGSYLVFTYGTKNEGFDWIDPHLWEILFSHQGGWLLYHPIMIGAMVVLLRGAYTKTPAFVDWRTILLVWTIVWYSYASWWNWWLGGSFGHRGFVEYYAILALPFTAFVHSATQWSVRWRWPVLVLVAFLIFLNIRMGLLAFSPMDGPTWTWDSLFTFWKDSLFL